ncbi:MAG TPA: two-component regulator propeller domain-containing protein [Bacteroidales bacterium]|nr:two-component regulator propeller domain-containing protein [Bacteroidales bacterium]
MKNIFTLLVLLASFQLNAQWETFNTANVPELKSDNIKSVVFSPNNNNLWFGTSDGLTRYDGDVWVTYTAASDDIAANEVNDITYAKSGYGPELWLSTQNGASVVAIETDGITAATPYRTGNSGIASNLVFSNGVSTAGNVIFGTDKGVSTLVNSDWKNITGIDSTNLVKYPVKSIATSKDGYSYLGSTGGGVYQYQDDVDGITLATVYEIPWSFVPSDTITTVFVDNNGNQWYGSNQGAGFHVGIQAKEGWTYYSTDDGLPDKVVNTIIEDSQGNIWFGTNNGLAMKKGQDWTIYTTADGLASNVIHDIAQDNNSVLWIATDNGISKFSPPWTGISQPNTTNTFQLNVHPNPARDGVYIRYNLPQSGTARVAVFDLSGRMIRQLVYGFNVAGEHEIFWNTAGDNGNYADAGIYVVRIQSNNLTTTKKMVILR